MVIKRPENGLEGPQAIREAATGDFRDIIALLREALRQASVREYVDMESVYADHVVVRDGARYWRYDYTLNDDNQVQLGAPREVTKTFIDAAMREAAASPFIEANDNSGMRFRIRAIKAGKSKNNAYYPDQVLREATPLFNGVRVFAKADAEHLAGGGKSFANLIGRLTDAQFVEGKAADGGEIQATLELLESAGPVAAKIREAHARGMSEIFGFSIDATGPMKKRGTMREAVSFSKVDSVDLIIEPGAGGQIINFIEALQDEDTDMKLRAQMLEAIKKNAPKRHAELGEDATEDQILTAYREATAPEQATREAAAQTGTDDPPAATQADIDQAVRMAEARADARAAIAESGLPEPAKQRLGEQFREARTIADGDVKKAIDNEAAYLARFTESGKVSGLGDTARVEGGEDRAEKVNAQLDALFDRTGKTKGMRSIREAYVDITGDTRITGQMKNCDMNRMREALGGHAFREAIDSSTFGDALGDAIRRAMVADYNAGSRYNVWRNAVDVVPVQDFRTNHRTRVGGYGDMPKVAERANYQQLASPTDEEATYAVEKRGGIEQITLETIKNDDMGLIQRIPTRMSRAAQRTLAKFVLDFLRLNPNIYDGQALFSAEHGNLGSAPLSSAGLAAGRLAMLQQTELDSNERLGIPPAMLYVPSDLEEAAFNLFRRQTNNDTDFIEQMQMAIYPVWYWTDVDDWCLVADPADIPTIELGFLDGQEEPEIFIQDMPNVGSMFVNDTITYKLRHIYGGNVIDYRGFYKSVVPA